LKEYFVANGFAYEHQKNIADVHITLTQILCAPAQLQSVYLKIKSILKRFDAFPLTCNKIINRLNQSDETLKLYPKGASSIALSFDDARLKRLLREIISVCKLL